MLYCQTSGQGPHLVLIHGFCEDNTCFSRQVLLLKDLFTVTLIDLPGFGNSPAEPGISMEGMADRVHEVLEHTGPGPYVMIGHSMGGYVTLAFAKKYASMLKGFGLLHSTAKADNEERKVKRDQALNVIREKGAAAYVRNFIPPLFASGFNDKAELDRLIQAALRSNEEGLSAALLAMRERPDSLDLLDETALPVLFVPGKEDAVIPAQDLFEQAARVKKSSVVYLQHSAHMGMIEEAETCAKGITEFVQHCFQQ